MFKQALQQAANDYGLVLSEQQLGQFTKYYELLVEWNQKINLTAITEPGEAAVKHMIDSLSAWNPELFAEDASLVDVGTGAGFPGIPLRIMHPGLRLTLLEPAIIQSILAGQQPKCMSLLWFQRHPLPNDWVAQREVVAAFDS